DFSLEATGFEIAEIDLRIESLTTRPAGDPDPADALPPINEAPAITRAGDLWLLGRHRVLCRDARDPLAYPVLMQRQQAGMVFPDPPKTGPMDGHAWGLGGVGHREFAMACGEMDESESTAFLASACGLAARHSQDGAIHFVCIDWRHLDELLAAG